MTLVTHVGRPVAFGSLRPTPSTRFGKTNRAFVFQVQLLPATATRAAHATRRATRATCTRGASRPRSFTAVRVVHARTANTTCTCGGVIAAARSTVRGSASSCTAHHILDRSSRRIRLRVEGTRRENDEVEKGEEVELPHGDDSLGNHRATKSCGISMENVHESARLGTS